MQRAIALLIFLVTVEFTVGNLDCHGNAVSCLDCSTLLVCNFDNNGEWQPAFNLSCPPEYPYCANGGCEDEADEQCSEQETETSTFICDQDGYFPDPLNCSRYYFCVEGKELVYSCNSSQNMLYDHRKAKCVAASWSSPCTSVEKCNGTERWDVYGQDQSVYFYCSPDSYGYPLVRSCPRDFRIDSSSLPSAECRLYCKSEGRMPDVTDDSGTKYYECLDVGKGQDWLYSYPILKVCPAGSVFDEHIGRCRAEEF